MSSGNSIEKEQYEDFSRDYNISKGDKFLNRFEQLIVKHKWFLPFELRGKLDSFKLFKYTVEDFTFLLEPEDDQGRDTVIIRDRVYQIFWDEGYSRKLCKEEERNTVLFLSLRTHKPTNMSMFLVKSSTDWTHRGALEPTDLNDFIDGKDTSKDKKEQDNNG